MELSLSRNDFAGYVCSQLNHFFPDTNPVQVASLKAYIDVAIDRVGYCFKHVAFERYHKNGITTLNHLYADQYLVFLWFLSNTIYKELNHNPVSNKIYYLNKALHGFDCMYDTALPDIFLIFHGVGTMLGKANYADYFVSLQGCTVGSQKGNYPHFGKGVALTAHSAIIGGCHIGDRVSVSAYTTLFETDINSDSVVFRDNDTGKTVVKQARNAYAQQFFLTDLNSL